MQATGAPFRPGRGRDGVGGAALAARRAVSHSTSAAPQASASTAPMPSMVRLGFCDVLLTNDNTVSSLGIVSRHPQRSTAPHRLRKTARDLAEHSGEYSSISARWVATVRPLALRLLGFTTGLHFDCYGGIDGSARLL